MKGRPAARGALLVLSIALLASLFAYLAPPGGDGDEHALGTIERDLSLVALEPPPSFEHDVRPVLDRRCVVCHGCYDAPCQLLLSSGEGLRRGASKEPVYDPRRVRPAQPTRLFVDARSPEEWRSLGFFPVINEGPRSPRANLEHSVLYRLLQLKQQHPQPETERLPDSFTLAIDREQTCTTAAAMNRFADDHPLWGMPYALPNLSEREYGTLVSWIAAGSPTPAPPAPSAAAQAQIDQWERFLNRRSLKQQLTSRYLYEHLFHARIHFRDTAPREFYRLVRSSTAPGEPVDEIATLRPRDDPGTEPFYYRLLRYHPSIVVKNHIVYEFSPQRMQRYRELFLQPDYEVRELPSRDATLAANPFKVFRDLPVKSRYRFLLDDAGFFINGFIKGPVCRGQIALNVIEDRFWVLFFNPEQDVFTNDAQFIGSVADDLQLPAEPRGSLNLLSIWTDYWQRQRRYMATKQALFEKINTHDIDHALGYIWDGDGNNPNASLTVFRHFDSGSVALGLAGDAPDSAWIIDYPLFERIHYLLVAGFNVFGNVVHQLDTRIYMDFLRMEGEDHFLAFLPPGVRGKLRAEWYAGLRKSVEKLFTAPQDWLQVESVRGYRTDDPQAELYRYIARRVGASARRARAVNLCGDPDCRPPEPDAARAVADAAMATVARMKGTALHAFPDATFVRITTDDPQHDLAYTLIRNKAYKNVTSFLADERERDRADIEHDTMTVVDWLEGSYPNLFLSVPLSGIEAFTRQCAAVRSDADFRAFIDRYGVRRTDPAFWPMADWFQDEYARARPVTSGLFDLSRYANL